jgi:hypothetical protein
MSVPLTITPTVSLLPDDKTVAFQMLAILLSSAHATDSNKFACNTTETRP